MKRWTSLAAFVSILLFSVVSDSLMEAVGPVKFLLLSAILMGHAWRVLEIERTESDETFG